MEEKTVWLIICFAVSFLTAAGFSVCALWRYHRQIRGSVLAPLQLGTLGIFLAVAFMFIPYYFKQYSFGDGCTVIRPILLSLHNSLRVFILDGDFDCIPKVIAEEKTWLQVSYSLYAALLYILAPFLTFSNLLPLFKNMKGELRYRFARKSKHYIMSELNAKSLALAKSIRKKEKKSVIVFTDVFERNEENAQELLAEAEALDAVFLRRDITHVDISGKEGDVEFFLLGANESENISQAVNITTQLKQADGKNRYRKKKNCNIKVFLFSKNNSATYIMDSMRYENLLHTANDQYSMDSKFMLRRINEVKQLIWNTVPSMHVFDIAQKNDNTLSVLIVGFGSYGMELFKMLTWYCQFEGYRLQINIVDKLGKEKHGSHQAKSGKYGVRSLIDRFAPELMRLNRSEIEGESSYDIEILPPMDMETSYFADLLFYKGEDAEKTYYAERLKGTNLVLVGLGDDDLNIDTAVYLRSLFDRVKGMKAKKNTTWEDEQVEIYSVVYDDQKSGVLHYDGKSKRNTLTNHAEIPYHIHFIGKMSDQFDYSNIYNPDLEMAARAHHKDWSEIRREILQERPELEEETAATESTEGTQPQEKKRIQEEEYEKHEYYRTSSIAKELYLREIAGNSILSNLAVHNGCLKTCACEKCMRRKRSEHMRWNAYTRIIGYSYSKDGKNDRAKLHGNLCAWDDLSELEKQMD